ncbi:MAG TPA: TonB-dependent receptor, partial [Terriglobales bacterium]|nr:TonB-dependent receptor [Terriglobales bacterium]
RLQLADTFTLEGHRHSWKFGGDATLTWIRNFFPVMFGGEYIFDQIRVNQWTFQPQRRGGMVISPLRAYAHNVPRYYMQDFGSAVSHPDSNDYSWFVQDTARISDHLAVTLGLRYDLQTFRSDDLQASPLWPDSGKVPFDTNNFAPRIGFAYSLGDRRPLVIRGGYGMFFTRIPQIYNSAVETNNGLNRSHLFLNASDTWDGLPSLIPAYPNPLVRCAPAAITCTAPPEVASSLTTEVSAFSHDFRTPVVEQASLGLEREVANRFAIGASYLYVHGEHLIRARDANLPEPLDMEYPVFSADGKEFLGSYYTLSSFAPWQMRNNTECPFAPCISTLMRPVPQLGSVDVFESAASSYYHGLTVSARRRMTNGLYFRAAYTWARAIDNGQDSLVAGRPATVQNSYSPESERGLSSTDQRHRFVFSWMAEPRPFHRDHPIMKNIFNGWKLSSVLSFGSGRPVNPRVVGDANVDGNSDNDRLPGARRNSFTGPDYATTDFRISRTVAVIGQARVELLAESFNLLNRVNQKVEVTDDGFSNSAAKFVEKTQTVGGKIYPAQFQLLGGFLTPTSSYAPRQVQFAVRLKF